MADEIEVEIIFDPKFPGKAKARIQKEALKTGKKAGNNFESAFSRAIGGIKGQLLGIGTAFAAAFAFKGAVSAVAEIEKIETGLKTLLGSAGLARETLGDLQKFAATTPFELPGIANAANTLLAFGFAQDELLEKLEDVGEVAAGTGKDFGELALIFGQVSAAGKLTGERLLQLQERGVPIGSALAKTFGVAEAQVRDLVSTGKVGFKEFEQAFASLSDQGGLFEGALVAQSQTVGGVLSTLRDNFFNLQVEIGRTFGPAIIATAQQFIGIFQQFSKDVAANGPVLTDTFKTLAEVLLITPSKFWLDFFAGDAGKNLKEVEAELKNANEQLRISQERLKSVEGSFFADLLGGAQQAREDIAKFNLKIIELENLRDRLLPKTNAAIEAEKKEAAARAANKKALEEQLAAEARKKQLREQLGAIGLTREEALRQQAQKDLEQLRIAREAEAILEGEFQARKLQREQQLNEQLAALKNQGATQLIDGLNATETAAVQSEKTIGDSLKNLGLGFKAFAAQTKTSSVQIAGALTRGLAGSAGNAFAAFGRAIATGEDAVKAFGTALLASFGNAIAQQGQGFILQGIAQSIAGFGSGAPLIAAGAGMVVFGTALAAKAQGAKQGGAGAAVSTGGGVGAAPGGLGQPENTLVAQTEELEEETRDRIVINGDFLNTEETGSKLLDLINEVNLNRGSVITNGAFA